MTSASLVTALSLLLATFCPVGANALAHAVNSAHVHGHENGLVHAHEHDGEGHHEHEVRHTDDAPRIAISVDARLGAGPSVERPAPSAAAQPVAPAPRIAAIVIRGPPLAPLRRRCAPSSAGRAPPA